MTEKAIKANGTNPPRIAVIGCGYWGVNYVRVASELAEARLAAICEPRTERLREIGARFPDAEMFESIDEMLSSQDIDAVVVATGATTHYDVTRRCIEAGKHVLVEKPLATDLADAAALVDLAERAGVTLMVGHTFIFNPSVRKIRSYIEAGTLGDIYYMYSRRTNLGPVRHDVNALWDLAPHDVSVFNHLLGSGPEWVSATGARLLRNSREDVGFMTLGYPGGVVGNIHVSWADPNKVRELVVVGSERRVVFDDVNQSEPIRLFERSVRATPEEGAPTGDFPLHIRDGDIISPRIIPSEPLKNQLRHFLDCLVTRAVPLTSGMAGVEVVAVMEAVTRSLSQNGAPVSLADQVAPLSVATPLPQGLAHGA